MHKNHLAVAFKMDIFETECPTCCWAEMWSPKTKEDVATITLSFTMPMITKATADKRLRVVAMMRFKANAFKAFRKITGQCAWRFAFSPIPQKPIRYCWWKKSQTTTNLKWCRISSINSMMGLSGWSLVNEGLYFLRFLNEFSLCIASFPQSLLRASDL